MVDRDMVSGKPSTELRNGFLPDIKRIQASAVQQTAINVDHSGIEAVWRDQRQPVCGTDGERIRIVFDKREDVPVALYYTFRPSRRPRCIQDVCDRVRRDIDTGILIRSAGFNFLNTD